MASWEPMSTIATYETMDRDWEPSSSHAPSSTNAILLNAAPSNKSRGSAYYNTNATNANNNNNNTTTAAGNNNNNNNNNNGDGVEQVDEAEAREEPDYFPGPQSPVPGMSQRSYFTSRLQQQQQQQQQPGTQTQMTMGDNSTIATYETRWKQQAQAQAQAQGNGNVILWDQQGQEAVMANNNSSNNNNNNAGGVASIAHQSQPPQQYNQQQQQQQQQQPPPVSPRQNQMAMQGVEAMLQSPQYQPPRQRHQQQLSVNPSMAPSIAHHQYATMAYGGAQQSVSPVSAAQSAAEAHRSSAMAAPSSVAQHQQQQLATTIQHRQPPATTTRRYEIMPPNHPPVKIANKTSLSSKLAAPIKTKPKVRPGRLFVRMPLEEGARDSIKFELGEFVIGLNFTAIDSKVVERARRRLEKKAEKEMRWKKPAVYGKGEKGGGKGGSGKGSGKGSGGIKKGGKGGKKAGKGGKKGAQKDDDDEDEQPTEPSNGGALEARDEVETTAENYRHVKAAAERAERDLEIPKLASLSIQHVSRAEELRINEDGTTVTTSTSGRLAKRTVWSSAPGVNFVGAASLSTLAVRTDGTVTEHFSRAYDIQTVDNIRRGPAHVITMVGQLSHRIVEGGELAPDSPRYSLRFVLEPESSRALKFSLRTEGGAVEDGYDYRVNSAQLFCRIADEEGLQESEGFFGMGARYSRPNLRGLEVQVCHPSGNGPNGGSAGNGGGGGGGGGSTGNQRYGIKNTTNSSTLPHFVSTSGTSLHLHNVEPTIFDFANPDWYSVRTPASSSLSGTFVAGTSILHALELHTKLKGRTRPLPKWTQRNGILVGIQGGTVAVQHVCRNFFKYKCPISGVLIKDWTGCKSTPNGGTHGNNASWFNYVLEREHYTGWQPLVDSLERRGISVGLYLTPYLEEIPMVLRSGRRYLFEEAKADYFVKKKVEVRVKNGGKKGNKGDDASRDSDSASGNSGVLVGSGGSKKGVTTMTMLTEYNQFKKSKCGMLDTTNYNATSWFKEVIKEEILEYASASFWLADNTSLGGSPMDGVYTSHANDGLSYHNSYAEEWAKVNREAIREAGRDGDSFFITNSAYGSTSKHTGCTSLGDYTTNFHNDSNGGILRSIMNGIINGGFSGLTHGHCAVNLAVPRQLTSAIGSTIDSKSREMICRWFEMTAFTTLFRTHDGESGMNENSSSTVGGGGSSSKNAGTNMLCGYDDEGVMKALSRWSKVFVALAEYRLQVINEASFKGYPVVRHPILHFPQDENFNRRETKKKNGKDGGSSSAQSSSTSSNLAFMLGELMYVVPVLKSGVSKKKVYLPEGPWIHLWTMEQVAGPHNIGKTIEVKAPLGEPPVFIRDCAIMHQLVASLKQKRIIATKKKGSGRLFTSFRKKKVEQKSLEKEKKTSRKDTKRSV